MAVVYRSAPKTVASLPGVQAANRATAAALGARAAATLAEHRSEGTARIEVTHGRRDSLVSLVDDAALSIEYGRAGGVTEGGRQLGAMQGLHILGREL